MLGPDSGRGPGYQRRLHIEAKRITPDLSIYSLNPDLRHLLLAANSRYLAFLSQIDDPTAPIKALNKLSESTQENGQTYQGYNLFSARNQSLCDVLVGGEFYIRGLRNADLRAHLPGKNTAQISNCLKRLRVHPYKHCVTEFGRRVILTGLKLKELVVIPALAQGVTHITAQRSFLKVKKYFP